MTHLTTENQLLALDEYIKMLSAHDWTYDYSDDHSVWRRGKANERGLRTLASVNPMKQQAYDAYLSYHFGSDGTWQSRKLILHAAIEAIRHQIKVEAVVVLIDPVKPVTQT